MKWQPRLIYLYIYIDIKLLPIVAISVAKRPCITGVREVPMVV